MYENLTTRYLKALFILNNLKYSKNRIPNSLSIFCVVFFKRRQEDLRIISENFSPGEFFGRLFCVIHFVSYSPIFKENCTHILCHTHSPIHFYCCEFFCHTSASQPNFQSYIMMVLQSLI